MKKVEAIVKPFKLDDVKESLKEIGIQVLLLLKLKVLEDKRDILSFIEEQSML